MTPQERELITGLFDRLASLEGQQRDAEAERAIIEGLRRAPNAAYALVQTALVQDEALRRADARIQALEQQLGQTSGAQSGGGFLDNMREALLGPRGAARGGSVPSVRPQAQSMGAAPSPGMAWQPGPSGGSSFLGTAAAAAAGVIGGSLLLDGIRSMMAPSHAAFYNDPGFGAFDPGLGASQPNPWGGGELAREAGINDIGRDDIGNNLGRDPNTGGGGFGLFDANDDAGDPGTDFADNSGDFGGDFGGGGDFSSDV
jgi:hypothetical protein